MSKGHLAREKCKNDTLERGGRNSLRRAEEDGLLALMADLVIPPHLKIAESVTAEEYATAKKQQVIVYSTALVTGMVAVVVIFLFGIAMVWSLVGGGLLAIGCERVMDGIFPEGKKMRTQRMKVYLELKAYRDRAGS